MLIPGRLKYQIYKSLLKTYQCVFTFNNIEYTIIYENTFKTFKAIYYTYKGKKEKIHSLQNYNLEELIKSL